MLRNAFACLRSGAGSRGDRLVSALEVERGGTRAGRRSGEPLGCAEREGLIVLCDDRDFRTVVSVTGQLVKFVADP